MAEINANPETMQARMEVQMQLDMAKDMDGHAHMGHGGGEMSMNMGSPYDELEVQARVALTEMLRESHTNEAAQNAFSESASLPTHAWRVLSWGRKFERDITDIFADGSTSRSQKRAAVAAAIETILLRMPATLWLPCPSMLTCIWPMTTRMVRKRLFPG